MGCACSISPDMPLSNKIASCFIGSISDQNTALSRKIIITEIASFFYTINMKELRYQILTSILNSILMENKRMNYDVNQARIYKDAYRPSSNLTHFIKALCSIILIGGSPITTQNYYPKNKRLK